MHGDLTEYEYGIHGMRANSFSRKSTARRAPGAILGTLFTLAIATQAGPAQAQWLVHDVGSATAAAAEYSTQADRWVNTTKHYAEEIAHFQSESAYWQSVYAKLSTFNLQMFAMTNQFKRIDDDYGVADECPGASGGLVGDITSALSSFVPKMGGDVIKQQRDLCRMIVMTKNHKYNSTVDYLTFLATQTQTLTSIQEQRLKEVDTSPGKLDSNLVETARYATNIDTAKTEWETEMQQADAQITMLKQMQSILSRRAMNGEPSALGTVVNIVALKGAFSTGN